jgi:tRNA nucleotidyltransferase (CCA-adding enzyme)
MGAQRSIRDAVTSDARLAAIAAVVAARDESAPDVFVVGGTVRDILLGAEHTDDIDLAVEGDAIAFAYLLADALGGHATPHRKFGTAVVSLPDGQHVDVVTTRRESYHAPGALPTVEHAELAHDLQRRDFTVNAMAASLGPDDLGTLFDPYGGQKDLAEGTIRVLHDASFVDDPTRILRAITYEARFGFRLDAHSEALARACVASGHVGELASSRVRDELVDLFEDPHAVAGVRRLGELGVDAAIHPRLRGGDEAAALFSRALAIRDELGVDTASWRLGLAALAREMSAEEISSWLRRIKVRRKDADRIAAAVAVAPRIVARLREKALEPAEVVALANPYAPDAPLMALALEDRPELRDYFAGLRDVRLQIGGADLIAMGLPESPRIGQILGELRRRKLNGELDGREAELEAARELVAAAVA